VTWRGAAPDERPEGIVWHPLTEDDTAKLAYDAWKAQQDCLDAVESGDHDVVAFLAGYGSGKSVFGARWLLAQALEQPGSRFLAMGVDFQKVRDTTYPKLFEQFPGERTTLTTSGYNGPENSPIVEDYNRQEHRLTLANDSVITLGSADKYLRYAGAEFGAVWMDEPSHYGDELHDLTGMITTRLRGVDGPKTQLWTLTGEGYNAAWEILEQRQDADGWRMYGYDAGWRDPRILLEIGKTDHGQLLVINEFHRSKSHVDEAINWFRTSQKPKGSIFCEHEPADIRKFREAGFRAGKVKKSIDAGIAEVRRRLGEDDNSRVGFLISDRCQHLVREFLGYKEPTSGRHRPKITVSTAFGMS
jgi:hypothetical protein